MIKKALILAGGFGSRLKEMTKTTPKPMLSLQGRKILEYSIDLCKRYGITEIVISVFYLKEQIKDYFKEGNDFGVNITYVEEEQPLGTAGALSLCKHLFDEPFVMCNADELKDINVKELYDQHITSKAKATIALTRVPDPSQYGVVELNGKRIERFIEKPKKEETKSNLISAGFYIINPEVIDIIPKGFSMIEKDVFPKLASSGDLFGFEFSGQWFDTGTPERYAQAEKSWKGFNEPAGIQKISSFMPLRGS